MLKSNGVECVYVVDDDEISLVFEMISTLLAATRQLVKSPSLRVETMEEAKRDLEVN